MRDYPLALPAFLRANKLMPNDYRILYNIGLCYSGMDEETEAARKFRAALKINPEESDIVKTLAPKLIDFSAAY